MASHQIPWEGHPRPVLALRRFGLALINLPALGYHGRRGMLQLVPLIPDRFRRNVLLARVLKRAELSSHLQIALRARPAGARAPTPSDFGLRLTWGDDWV